MSRRARSTRQTSGKHSAGERAIPGRRAGCTRPTSVLRLVAKLEEWRNGVALEEWRRPSVGKVPPPPEVWHSSDQKVALVPTA